MDKSPTFSPIHTWQFLKLYSIKAPGRLSFWYIARIIEKLQSDLFVDPQFRDAFRPNLSVYEFSHSFAKRLNEVFHQQSKMNVSIGIEIRIGASYKIGTKENLARPENVLMSWHNVPISNVVRWFNRK